MSLSDGLGPVAAVEPSDLGAGIRCRAGALRIEVIGPGTIRVRVSRDGEWSERRDWDVLALPATAPADLVVLADDGPIVIGDGSLTAEVDPANGSVRFVTAAGAEIAPDARPGAVTWGDDGRLRVQKRRHPDERHVGFGERARLDQTAGTKTFWNVNSKNYGPATDEMYCTVPVFVAHRTSVIYGFFLNTPGWARIHSDPGSELWTAEVAGRELDYVVVAGDGPAQVLERLTAVIGRIELPPRWAIGYHQSRWGYDSASKLMAVADEFAKRGLPCEVLHVDIDYMDSRRVFTWDPGRFPDPPGLMAELRIRGLRAVAILDPGVAIHGSNPVYEAGLKRDAFVRGADGEHVVGYVWPGRCVFPDFLRAEIRRWWADLHEAVVGAGVSGVWNDMNEPALYDGPVGADETANVVEMPGDAVQGPAVRPVRHAEVHNLYGVSMTRAAHEALARWRPDERSFSLTRSGHAGVQRYAAVWTGDNASSWEHLRMSLPVLCNLGLSGVPFVGADIGGFFGDATPELFARWMQTGVLYPMMRAHSHRMSQPNEPWAFGEQIEHIARQALRLRYELQPYVYSLFREAATTGAPVLRPLLWAHADDARAAAIEDQVMLGDALLAAPVMKPGERARDVYFPAGRWYDWWSGEAHDGPRVVPVDAPLDRLPLFGRAGSVVPLATVRDDGTIDASLLTLRVFPGSGSGSIYDDDGETFAYRSGDFALRTYEVRATADGAVVHLSVSEGAYRSAGRRWRLMIGSGSTVDVPDDWGDGREIVEVTVPAAAEG